MSLLPICLGSKDDAKLPTVRAVSSFYVQLVSSDSRLLLPHRA